jgi:threonine dehydrogenase-like Zn-dependent dehydrogenase
MIASAPPEVKLGQVGRRDIRGPMKALQLEAARKLVVRNVPDPAVPAREVLIRVRAVGLCGTDFHIYAGHGNYNFDSEGRQVPLTVQPQVLGHEFSGEIVEVAAGVRDLKPGDRVLCDQGRNCVSLGRKPLCRYCASGDSHQCVYYGEHGITGLQGALADYITMPAVNCVRLPADMSFTQAALVEPFGCVLHSSDWMERARNRYTFDGPEQIRSVLICGAGPAGLLFLQYLRNVRRFDGLILVSDRRENNLELVWRFGGAPVNVARQDLRDAVHEATGGKRVEYLIDACGNPQVLADIPGVLAKQGAVLFYASGHNGSDTSVLDPIFFLEPTLVAGVGASGGFDSDGRPHTYRRALELVHNGTVQVLPYVTHHYTALEQIPGAFENDFARADYIKGVLNCEK